MKENTCLSNSLNNLRKLSNKIMLSIKNNKSNKFYKNELLNHNISNSSCFTFNKINNQNKNIKNFSNSKISFYESNKRNKLNNLNYSNSSAIENTNNLLLKSIKKSIYILSRNKSNQNLKNNSVNSLRLKKSNSLIYEPISKNKISSDKKITFDKFEKLQQPEKKYTNKIIFANEKLLNEYMSRTKHVIKNPFNNIKHKNRFKKRFFIISKVKKYQIKNDDDDLIKEVFYSKPLTIKYDYERSYLNENKIIKKKNLLPFQNSYGLLLDDAHKKSYFIKGSINFIYPRILIKKIYENKKSTKLEKLIKEKEKIRNNLKKKAIINKFYVFKERYNISPIKKKYVRLKNSW